MQCLWILVHLIFCFSLAEESPSCVLSSDVGCGHSNTTDAEGPSYFHAKGSSPEWELNISNDQIVFTSALSGLEKFSAAHAEPEKVMDGNMKKYDVHNPNGVMSIFITQGSCQVPDSREGFSYKVEVHMKAGTDTAFTSFTGCGLYITDARLYGSWVLEEIKGRTVTNEAWPGGRPGIDIKANANSFSGFGGCNTMSGRIFSERNLLRFTDIVLTKVTCDAATMESSFISALRFSTQFDFVDQKLVLSYPGQVTLIFTKKDQ